MDCTKGGGHVPSAKAVKMKSTRSSLVDSCWAQRYFRNISVSSSLFRNPICQAFWVWIDVIIIIIIIRIMIIMIMIIMIMIIIRENNFFRVRGRCQSCFFVVFFFLCRKVLLLVKEFWWKEEVLGIHTLFCQLQLRLICWWRARRGKKSVVSSGREFACWLDQQGKGFFLFFGNGTKIGRTHTSVVYEESIFVAVLCFLGFSE